MDKTGEKDKLESAQREIEHYCEHAISREIFSDNKEKQEEIIEMLTTHQITDLESLFRHVAAVGVLRGLRQHKAIIDGNLQAIQEKLKEL